VYTYADLQLDMDLNVLVTNEINKVAQQKDIVIDYDLAAIRNSLRNLFLTALGDKILNPEFGMDLRYFLFYPVSDTIAFSIRQEILRNIVNYEPRITINSLDVIPEYDNQQYTINISVSVPSLNVGKLVISLYLNSQGYVTFI
jgi:hypothetical protein